MANPLESYAPGIILVDNLAKPEIPDVEIYVVPASTASGQPSPSESRSLLFIIPSPSLSQASTCAPINTLSIPKSSLVAVKLKLNVLELTSADLGILTIIFVVGTLFDAISILETFTVALFLPTTLAVVPPLGLLMVAYILLFKITSKDAVLGLVISHPYPFVLTSKTTSTVVSAAGIIGLAKVCEILSFATFSAEFQRKPGA